MSALGQKQTLAQVDVMSALPPIADIRCCLSDVRFVPKADVSSRSKATVYSITSSARDVRFGSGTDEQFRIMSALPRMAAARRVDRLGLGATRA